MHLTFPNSVSLCGFLLLSTTCWSADAGQWTSPDGIIRVNRPDSGTFKLTAPDDEFLVHWQSKDKLVQLGVLESSWSRSVPPRRKLVERGFFDENGLTRVASVTGKVDGRDAWLMVGRADDVGYEYYMQQLIVPVDRKVYKLMAVSALHRPDSVPSIGQFFQSVQLAKRQAKPPTASPNSPVQPVNASTTENSAPETIVIAEKQEPVDPVVATPEGIDAAAVPAEAIVQDEAEVPPTPNDPPGDAVEMMAEKIGFLLIPLMAVGLFFIKSRKRHPSEAE